MPLFPASNWWNLDITQAPVDPASASFVSLINVVDGTQTKLPVTFLYSDGKSATFSVSTNAASNKTAVVITATLSGTTATAKLGITRKRR